MIRRIPNVLTIFRMCLAVPLAISLFRGQIWWALGLLLVAGITDLADGFIARNFGASTVLGSWLDPAADKLIITTVLISLTIVGTIPLWFCVLTMTRDVGLVGGTLFLKIKGYGIKIQPYLTGKMATVMQNIVLLTALLEPIWSVLWFYGACLFVSTLLTTISAVTYAKGFWQVYTGPR